MAVEMSKVYPDIARVWLGTRLIVFLTHPDDVEIILGSSVHLDKAHEYRLFQPWQVIDQAINFSNPKTKKIPKIIEFLHFLGWAKDY